MLRLGHSTQRSRPAGQVRGRREGQKAGGHGGRRRACGVAGLPAGAPLSLATRAPPCAHGLLPNRDGRPRSLVPVSARPGLCWPLMPTSAPVSRGQGERRPGNRPGPLPAAPSPGSGPWPRLFVQTSWGYFCDWIVKCPEGCRRRCGGGQDLTFELRMKEKKDLVIWENLFFSGREQKLPRPPNWEFVERKDLKGGQ